MPADSQPGIVALGLARPFASLPDPSDDGGAARLLSGKLRSLVPEPGCGLVAALDCFIALAWLHPLLGGGAVKTWLSRSPRDPKAWADDVWNERLAISGCALGVANRAIDTIVVRLAGKPPNAEREMHSARLADVITHAEMLGASVHRAADFNVESDESGAFWVAAALLVASIEVAGAALDAATLLVDAGSWTEGRLHRRANVIQQWRRLDGGPDHLLCEVGRRLFEADAPNSPS